MKILNQSETKYCQVGDVWIEPTGDEWVVKGKSATSSKDLYLGFYKTLEDAQVTIRSIVACEVDAIKRGLLEGVFSMYAIDSEVFNCE